MKRLNAQDWADGICATIWGFRVGVRVSDPLMLPELLKRLPPDWKPSTTRKVQWLWSLLTRPSRADPQKIFAQLHSGPELLTRGTDLQRVLDAFAMELRATLALGSPWRVFIHAGAVGWKGKGIIIPGESGAGKTSLTLALLEAGATLFSDEYAVLDRKGILHPYPLFVRVRTDGKPGSERVPLDDLDARVAPKPLPVGLVLSTRYRSEGGTRLVRLSEGRAALELMAHAVQARLHPDRVMATAGKAVEGAIAMKGPRGEAKELVDEILGLW